MKLFRKPSKAQFGMALKLTVSYSFLLILILFISMYFYHASKTELQKTLESRIHAQLFNAVDTLDGDLSAMHGFALSFAQNREISTMARSNPGSSDDFFINSYKTQQELISNVPMERLLPITSYFIYFPNSDYVLTTGSCSDMELFYTRESFLHGHYGEWHDMIANENAEMSLIPLSKYSPSSEDFLYLVPLDSYLFYRIPAQVGFMVDRRKIEQHFSGLFSPDSGYLYVTDLNGNCEFQIGQVPSDNFQPEHLTDLSYQNNTAQFQLAGNGTTVVRSISSANKWRYYYVMPVNAIQTSLRPYQNMYILVTGASLLACFLLIYFLSKRNTRPFVRMGNQLETSLSRSQQLESTLQRQQPIIRNSYIRNIMLNRISSADEMDYIRETLNLTRTDVSYYVLYIVAYPDGQQTDADPAGHTQEAESASPDLKAALDKRILSGLKEFFGEPLYLFNPKGHNYAILLHDAYDVTCEGLSEKIDRIFTAFHKKMLEECGVWTMAGMGNLNHLLENTWKSYQQAMESASYASSKHYFRCYNSLDLNSDIYYFPDQLSESLAGFITAGNRSQVEEIFKFIYKENMEKRSLSYPKLQSLLMSIYNTLCRIRCTISDDSAEEQIQAVDFRLGEYLSLKQLEDAAVGLCALFKGKSSSKQTIHSMQDYINDNYRDPSLCLTKLSDEFGLSESYISYLFKESTGNNFSMYLEQIRMKEARRLVTECSVPLSEIYREVGYNNPNSFRRVFKKTFGVSAKTMRDSLTRESER